MTSILLFWAKKGVDAFRCDMAEMVPTAFWAWATDKVKFMYPEVKFIGEVYNPSEYRNYIGAGFDWLYDKVGMYDCVRDVICGKRPAAAITYEWQATDDIHDHMLYFLENHDEQRLASPFFAGDARKGVPALIANALMLPNPGTDAPRSSTIGVLTPYVMAITNAENLPMKKRSWSKNTRRY